MDKEELEKLYAEKLDELEAERNKLDEMYQRRVAMGKPLTDHDILRQNECCSGISLKVTKLKELLEEFED